MYKILRNFFLFYIIVKSTSNITTYPHRHGNPSSRVLNAHGKSVGNVKKSYSLNSRSLKMNDYTQENDELLQHHHQNPSSSSKQHFTRKISKYDQSVTFVNEKSSSFSSYSPRITFKGNKLRPSLTSEISNEPRLERKLKYTPEKRPRILSNISLYPKLIQNPLLDQQNQTSSFLKPVVRSIPNSLTKLKPSLASMESLSDLDDQEMNEKPDRSTKTRTLPPMPLGLVEKATPPLPTRNKIISMKNKDQEISSQRNPKRPINRLRNRSNLSVLIPTDVNQIENIPTNNEYNAVPYSEPRKFINTSSIESSNSTIRDIRNPKVTDLSHSENDQKILISQDTDLSGITISTNKTTNSNKIPTFNQSLDEERPNHNLLRPLYNKFKQIKTVSSIKKLFNTRENLIPCNPPQSEEIDVEAIELNNLSREDSSDTTNNDLYLDANLKNKRKRFKKHRNSRKSDKDSVRSRNTSNTLSISVESLNSSSYDVSETSSINRSLNSRRSKRKISNGSSKSGSERNVSSSSSILSLEDAEEIERIINLRKLKNMWKNGISKRFFNEKLNLGCFEEYEMNGSVFLKPKIILSNSMYDISYIRQVENFYIQYLWKYPSVKIFENIKKRKRVILMIDNSEVISTRVGSQNHYLKAFKLVGKFSEFMKHYENVFSVIGLINMLSNIEEMEVDAYFLNKKDTEFEPFFNILNNSETLDKFFKTLLEVPNGKNPYLKQFEKAFESITKKENVFMIYIPGYTEPVFDDSDSSDESIKNFGFDKFMKYYIKTNKNVRLNILVLNKHRKLEDFLSFANKKRYSRISLIYNIAVEFENNKTRNQRYAKNLIEDFVGDYYIKCIFGKWGENIQRSFK